METPSTGSARSRKAGRSCGGSWNDRPSSPPVTVESWEARTATAEATASVIIEKKIALTRRDRRPMAAAGAADAEEHGVGEGHDARITEQQVVARHKHDEDADLRGGAQGLAAREQERGGGENQHDGEQDQAQHPG